jgi:Secretion system C-terminal sorting domain
MKHIFTLIIATATTLVSAQNLEIREAGGPVLNGTTVVHAGNASDFEIKAENYYVHNTSGSPIAVRCQRDEVSVVSGSKSALCWVICSADYVAGAQPSLTAPGGSATINPGDSLNLFVLHYKPEGNAGISLFKVIFYNPSVASDTAVFYVQFDAALSVSESTANPISLNAYPNPANNSINIAVENFNEKATLKIVDALGITVKTAQVNGDANLKFNTTDLRAGVYFYSLVSNNKTILTRRIVITR